MQYSSGFYLRVFPSHKPVALQKLKNPVCPIYIYIYIC